MLSIIAKSIEGYVECRECGYHNTGGYYLDALISLYIDSQLDQTLEQDEKEYIQDLAHLAVQLKEDPENVKILHRIVDAADRRKPS